MPWATFTFKGKLFVSAANNGCVNIKSKSPACVLPEEHTSTEVLLYVQEGGMRLDEVCLTWNQARHWLEIFFFILYF